MNVDCTVFVYFLVNLTARFAYCLGKRDLIACLPIQGSLRLLEDHRRHHYHTRLPHIQSVQGLMDGSSLYQSAVDSSQWQSTVSTITTIPISCDIVEGYFRI
uniref:Uncharacterized protein n=1 Tax=Glossina austeni TaxID=7395 RepID=A0A1A9UQ38_GLOAU